MMMRALRGLASASALTAAGATAYALGVAPAPPKLFNIQNEHNVEAIRACPSLTSTYTPHPLTLNHVLAILVYEIRKRVPPVDIATLTFEREHCIQKVIARTCSSPASPYPPKDGGTTAWDWVRLPDEPEPPPEAAHQCLESVCANEPLNTTATGAAAGGSAYNHRCKHTPHRPHCCLLCLLNVTQLKLPVALTITAAHCCV